MLLFHVFLQAVFPPQYFFLVMRSPQCLLFFIVTTVR